MLGKLIKKQFLECFRTYFVNTKTGKKRSKLAVISFFALFACIMMMLGSVFVGVAFLLGDALLLSDYVWLYFALMGMIAMGLGTFGSVFNTFSALYLAKDNDLLLSLPIPPSKILLSRIALVYGLSLLYSGIVWIPALAVGWIFGHFPTMAVLFQILLFPLIALLVTVLTCVLGWVIAFISKRTKNKSFITVALSLLFFFCYYYISSNMMNYLQNLVIHSGEVAEGMKKWGYPVYQLGLAANGNVGAMAVYSTIAVGLFAVCIFILSTSFIYIVTAGGSVQKKAYRMKTVKTVSVKSALMNKELRRFLGSPVYMLNTGLGIVILPILAVAGALKKDILQMVITEIGAEIPFLTQVPPLLILMIVCLILSINVISTPSISLEGKNLWILQSLPVTGAEVLEAKLNLHVVLNVIPGVLAAVILGSYILGDWLLVLLLSVFVWMFVWLTGAIGLVIGLLHPSFTWTTETMPVKQSINVLISLLIGWALVGVEFGGFYLLRNCIAVSMYLGISAAFVGAFAFAAVYWLKIKGGQIFENL